MWSWSRRESRPQDRPSALPSGPRSEVPGRLQGFWFSTDSFRIIFTEGYRAGKTAFLKLKERTDTKENRNFIITFRNHLG